ncbi:MAG: hydroxyethylthiazole kinase [Acetanaerobacterium sp.]
MKETLITQIESALQDMRQKKPLIHHITNYVTVNDCANIVLAIGASPIMADDIEEAEAITSISSALVLNIGTLNRRTVESMLAAGKKANELGIPVILDPVGAGASGLRNRTVERLIKEIKFSVLRGNMSEIRFVAGLSAATKGVDASDADLASDAETGRAVAETVAKKLGCVTAITGATDIVSDGSRTVYIENGTKLLSTVTGTGCMCTSLVGSFCGGTSDYLIPAIGGVLSMGIAGEIAAEGTRDMGSGSFHIAVIDALSKLSAQTLAGRAKIHEA